MIYLKLLKESLYFALTALWSNKLRTSLSLLGVTIGIFTIISVFSIIDSLRHNIYDSIEKNLGNDVVYIHKWPWAVDNNYPWWKYMNRPFPTLKEYQSLEKRMTKASALAFKINAKINLQYHQKNIRSNKLLGISEGFDKVKNINIKEGRFFSQKELIYGAQVVVVGVDIQELLFQGNSPIGKTIKLGNQKATIIGVIEKEGENMFGNSMDQTAIIPVNFMKTWLNIKSWSYAPEIWVKKKKDITVDELKDDIRRFLRPIRGIKPKDEDNFALNQTSMITKEFKQVFKMIDFAGIIIGSFSILIGAFGIANIMFVSVKERTKQIGIQKALGSKNFFILFQFVVESVFLSLMGGILGLFLVAILIHLANQFIEMTFMLDITNIIRGLSISFLVGLLSGYIPAKQASKLSPVVAISSET